MAKTPRLVIGLTGGIGSGKSAAADRFAQHGIAVVDTDDISRELTGANGAAMPAIKRQFGDAFLTPIGALNREAMRQRVFSDPLAKKQLEAVLHPLIRGESLKRIAAATSPYVILAVPLLFETGGYGEIVSSTLVVDCSEPLQIERTMQRSGMTEEQVRAVMAAQLTRKARLKNADDVIHNNGTLRELADEVDRLHKKYLAQSNHLPRA
ncbi:MAG: dephospho-CoA kinase [Burkholderiales bacterium]